MRSLRGSLSDGTGVSSALFAAVAKEVRSPKYFDPSPVRDRRAPLARTLSPLPIRLFLAIWRRRS